jgi:ketosteroid isomerase-like protein
LSLIAKQPLKPPGCRSRRCRRRNVDAVKRGLDAYNRQDLDALLEELDPDVEWHPALAVLLGGERTVFRGHQGVRESIQEEDEALAELHVEISEIRDLGNSVLAIGRIRARGRESGVQIESPFGALADLRNGKGIRLRTYLDLKKPSKPPGCRSRRGDARYTLLAAAISTSTGGSARLSKKGRYSGWSWLPAPLPCMESNGASLALPLIAHCRSGSRIAKGFRSSSNSTVPEAPSGPCEVLAFPAHRGSPGQAGKR